MEKESKRLIDITLDELDEFLLSRGYRKVSCPPVVEKKEEEFDYGSYTSEQLLVGDKELARYLDISLMSITNMKKSGYLDGTYFCPTPRRYIYIKEKVDRMIYRRRRAKPSADVTSTETRP